MAKDDYFKIVYILLGQLYKELRKGKKGVSIKEIMDLNQLPNIPKDYLEQIIQDCIEEGYISANFSDTKYVHQSTSVIESLRIKMDGVEYLQNNTTMKQIASLVTDIKAVLPI